MVERRCRELVNEGILEKQLVQIDGVGARVVQYRVVDVKEDLGELAMAEINQETYEKIFGQDFEEQTEKLNL